MLCEWHFQSHLCTAWGNSGDGHHSQLGEESPAELFTHLCPVIRQDHGRAGPEQKRKLQIQQGEAWEGTGTG